MPVADFLNVAEAAAVIGCTDARVRQMLISREILGIKATQTAWLIPKTEVKKAAKKPRRKGGRQRIGDT